MAITDNVTHGAFPLAEKCTLVAYAKTMMASRRLMGFIVVRLVSGCTGARALLVGRSRAASAAVAV